jgi:hypothetical protein
MASAVVMMMMMDGTTQAKTKVAKSATRHFGTRRAKHVTRRRPSSATPLRLRLRPAYPKPGTMGFIQKSIIQVVFDSNDSVHY